MEIKYVLLAELPFVFNLEDSYYDINLDSQNYRIYISNKCYAGVNGILGENSIQQQLQVADINTLKLNKKLTSFIKLRTIVYWEIIKSVSLTDINDETEIVNYYIRTKMFEEGFVHFGDKHYNQKLSEEYSKLPDKEKQIYIDRAKEFCTIRNNYPDETLFLRIINKFIQCYMLAFKNSLVEEITLKQLGYSVLNGIIKDAFDKNNNQIDALSHVGKFSYFVRKPWYQYSADENIKFKAMLITPELNQIQLLISRAKILLEHGIYRSAIIEANAAMEFSIQKRIYDSLINEGLSEEDTMKYLKDNQDFKYRCNNIFKEKIGFSLMLKDNTLWQAVVEYRKNLRNFVAHSNKELNKTETEDAITCFEKLANLAQE